MSRGLKEHYPDMRFSGNQVLPDEIDRYDQYVVSFPAISATYFGSATEGTVSEVTAIGLGNTRADYPRAVAAIYSGSASVSGTVAITGVNQFGVAITESVSLTQGTQIVGTAVGTKIFAHVTGATATMGTGVSGTGTVSLGVPIDGTSAWFGLPAKIGGTSDVKLITWCDENGLATALNGGTIGGYVSVTDHAFRGTEDLAGTMIYTILMKSSFLDETTTGTIANLAQ